MKNKKLFAILTLVCFMMTLMPVAAFAAEVTPSVTVTVPTTTSIVLEADSILTATESGSGTIKNAFLVKAGNAPAAAPTAANVNGKLITLTVPALTATSTPLVISYAGTATDYLTIGTDLVADFSVTKTFTVPVVSKVEATNATTVEITFDQALATVVLTPANYKVDNVAATAATVAGNKVTLTVAALADGKHTVAYAGTELKDSLSLNSVAAFSQEISWTNPYAGPTTGDKDTSAVYTAKNNPTVKVGDNVTIGYELNDARGVDVAAPEKVYIWFTEAGATLPSTGVKAITGATDATIANANGGNPIAGFYETTTAKVNDELKVSFLRAGEYTLHAATAADFTVADDAANTTAAEFMADLNEMKTLSTNKVITVKGANVDSNDYVVVSPEVGTAADGGTFATTLGVAANGVATTEVSFTVYEDDTKTNVVKGETVKIETSSSNIEVSKEEATTNALGKVSFAVSGVREGNYEIYVTCGSYEATIKVQVGATAPAYITVAKAPTAPVNIDDTDDLSNVVRFLITDINGNTLTSAQAAGQHAFVNDVDGAYAAIVSAPAGSDLGNEDVKLVNDTDNSNLALGLYSTLAIAGGLDVEGTYEFKVALDNGKAVYVTVEAKKFGTPVGIVLEYSAPSVELGGVMNTKDFLLVDKNGVTTKANGKVELAASGYAIANFDTTNGTITVKADEKYLGSTITVTAVSERYDLMTSASVKVVADAAGLMFATKTAEVDVNNAIQVVLVDAQGNRTAFGDARADRTNYDVNYVVLDKPEGAKVSVNTAAVDNNLLAAGSFKMNLTCDKVGTVKVQAIAKITKVAADGKDVVKYYTGVGEIAVGNGQTGKSVVMSIGSTEMITDGKVGTIDAKPMIQNGRTFVPFRALAEAFGATVAYDQETSAVKATLNGVEVVMTVGAPVYTVNGVDKTADVAPFISDSRTYVPVRFAAEAFGITVTPTYNADGSVADVLFNM